MDNQIKENMKNLMKSQAIAMESKFLFSTLVHFTETWIIWTIDEENSLDFLVNESMITSALGLALCYINRILKKDDKVQDVTYRILVIKASEDSSNQYMNFMNNVFSAEKLVNKQNKNHPL